MWSMDRSRLGGSLLLRVDSVLGVVQGRRKWGLSGLHQKQRASWVWPRLAITSAARAISSCRASTQVLGGWPTVWYRFARTVPPRSSSTGTTVRSQFLPSNQSR
jgi:hypothetical protein